MKCSSEDLKIALMIIAEAQFQEVPQENNIDYSFSQKFEIWAERLIVYRVDARPKKITVKRVIKIALIAAIIAALLTVTALAIPAVRQTIGRYLFRESGSLYKVEFVTDPPLETESNFEENSSTQNTSNPSLESEGIIKHYFAPTYFPDGYEHDYTKQSSVTMSVRYLDKRYNEIFYLQCGMSSYDASGPSIGMDTDEDIYKLNTNDLSIDVFPSSESRVMIWADEYYFYTLIITNDLSDDEAVKIINSIAPYTPQTDNYE